MEIIRYNEGGLGSYSPNDMSRAFVQTYAKNELLVELIDGEEVTEHAVRVKIGVNDGCALFILDNNRIYFNNRPGDRISVKSEISPKELYDCITEIHKLKTNVGELFNLRTNNKNSIVDAINELYSLVSNPRKLIGSIDYLSDGIMLENPNDLETRFNTTNNKFEYYSQIGEWITLPKNWQNLNHFVRLRKYLPLTANEGDKYGILEENEVVEYKDGAWISSDINENVVGDEIFIKHVYNKYYKGNAAASLVYTKNGWIILANYY